MLNEDVGNVTFKNDEWDYVTPDFPDGDCSFAGLPCPTNKAIKRFGEKGIEEIDKRIKEMIQWKKELYGKDSDRLGFDVIQSFENKAGDTIHLFGQVITPTNSNDSPRTYHVHNANYVINYSKGIISDKVNDVLEEEKAYWNEFVNGSLEEESMEEKDMENTNLLKKIIRNIFK